MSDPKVSRPGLRAIDADLLERLFDPSTRVRVRSELPVCRRTLDDVREDLATTGLLGPTSSLFVVGDAEPLFVAQVYAPEGDAMRTTLRIGLAAIDGGDRDPAMALAATIDHLFRTTAVARVERAVVADDSAARLACSRAGLAFEGVRRLAGLVEGRLVDLAVYVAERGTRPITAPSISRIAVLTGGGDAPGLNAVIRAVVKTAVREHGWTVLGVENGYEGLLGTPTVRELRPDDVRGMLPRGGTILGSRNRGRFNASDTAERDRALEEAVAAIEHLEVDALVAIGGDGTQRIAARLADRGVRVVGVPKTIDNDLEGTDRTFGFDTALDLATDAIDRLHTTAESHDRVMVVEVMGRTAGWIALHAAIAGGADVALIPEIPFSIDRVVEAIRRRDEAGRRFSIVVVAEGATPQGGTAVYQEPDRLGGVGALVADAVGRATGKESRLAVLGYLQRGGRPTAFDRVLATAFGTAAVRTLALGAFGRLVALSGGEITTVALASVAGRRRRIPLDSMLLRTAAELGIELGDTIARDV